jgi:hypothetical protein
VYLRETRRTRKDGSTVRYLQLAHDYRDPDTGHAIAKILYSFGRVDLVDRAALERLVGSVSRFLDEEPPSSGTGGEAEPVDGRDLGGAWVLDQLWGRLGIGKAIIKVARGRKLDAKAVERALFALVASRALAPSSKLEATRWVREEAYIDRLAEIDTDSCYRAMDFLFETLPELQETVFFTVADLLQLDVDLLFFDPTSTYFELEQPDVDPDDEDEPGSRCVCGCGWGSPTTTRCLPR